MQVDQISPGETATPRSPTEARRRAPPYVTKNACIECRKRKSRCDGKQPCGRCITHKVSNCQYEVSVRVSKEELKSEIEALRNYRRLSEHVLASLSGGLQSELILSQLAAGKGLKTISLSLDSDPPFISSSSGSRFGETDSSQSLESEDQSMKGFHFAVSGKEGFPTTDGEFQDGDPDDQDESMGVVESNRQWTSVTSDSSLIENLVQLYFCWEYPVFAGFVKNHFLADFREGRDRYCSSLLVNAILALGSGFSEQLEKSSTPENPKILSERFFHEAERLWEIEEEHPSLTTIQALCLMSLREANWGREQESWFYSGQAICLAAEMGLNIQAHSEGMSIIEEEVRVATFWGACTIDQAFAIGLGRLPHISRKGIRVRKPIIVGLEEEDDWVPYSDGDQTPRREGRQASNSRSVYRSFCELANIMHGSSYELFQPGKGITSQNLINMYVRYLDWYNALPEVLRLGNNSTPVVLFVHMHYHFAIIQLFRPFIKLRLLSSRIAPREICIQAANAITSLVHTYRQLYGLRRTPSFMPYIVLTATIIHIVTDHAESNDVLSAQTLQCVLDLEEMSVSFQFARTASSVLRVIIESWDSAVNMSSENQTPNHLRDPKTLRMFTSICPDKETLIAIRYNYKVADYPLFAIYPAQGLPLLAGGDNPRDSGFELSR